MKTILITGGAGFIGTSLALQLIEKGYSIRIVDNLLPQVHGNTPLYSSATFPKIAEHAAIEFIEADIRDRNCMEAAIKGVDAIVHFAAETGTGQSMYKIEHYNDVNIGGTALLLDILTNQPHQVRKLIVASSRSIYGEGKYRSPRFGIVYPAHRSAAFMDKGDFEVKYPGEDQPLELLPTDESSKLHPSSVYGITKQVQEQLVLTVCPAIGIAPVSLRFQNVYGPGQSLSNPYTGILSIFASLIKNNKEINIFEDGQESRDFVYIDDVVESVVLSLEKPEANGGIFNVGTGEAVNVIRVAKTLCKNLGMEVPMRISGNYRIGDIRHNFADITAISKRLGFIPKVSFEEGVSRFVKWVNTQHTLSAEGYTDSLQEMQSKGLYK